MCGAACGYSLEQHPEGYGYPSLSNTCSCNPRSVGTGTWVDLRGVTEWCPATRADDPAPLMRYHLAGSACVEVTVPWDGWWSRVHVPDLDYPHTLRDGGVLTSACFKVAGAGELVNLPPVLVEVFSTPGDGWVRVDAVPCAGQAAGTVAACAP